MLNLSSPVEPVQTSSLLLCLKKLALSGCIPLDLSNFCQIDQKIVSIIIIIIINNTDSAFSGVEGIGSEGLQGANQQF